MAPTTHRNMQPSSFDWHVHVQTCHNSACIICDSHPRYRYSEYSARPPGLHNAWSKAPPLYGTRMFIIVFTRTSHLNPFHIITSQSSKILSFHLQFGLPIYLFPSGFPTETVYAFLMYPMRDTWPATFILPDLMIVTDSDTRSAD
jgi:hypothetical protein